MYCYFILGEHMSHEEVFFKWSQDYSVNIKTIDDQHRELVNILNRLFVAVSKREGEKVIAGILDALMSYTQTHFALEERLMRQAKYKDLEPHMEEHRKLLEQLDLAVQEASDRREADLFRDAEFPEKLAQGTHSRRGH